MSKVKLILWGCVFSISAFGQSRKITSITTAAEIINCAVDRAGDFYVILQTGELQKYDKNGVKLGTFNNKEVPTVFDPTNALRLLIYNQPQQEYAWLSPNLDETPFLRIDPTVAIEPVLLCPSGDLHLWVLDQADMSLKRFNPRASNIFNEFSIRKLFPDKTSFIQMREYQNFLFLLDPETGIHIFNYLGKPIKKIEEKHLAYFNFLGEELYYLKDGAIQFVDLFTTETRRLELAQSARFVLMTDERMMTIRNNTIEIFEFVP